MRLALLEEKFVSSERRFLEHERRHDEFMTRTDTRLDTLVIQSNEWAGVRKTLAAIAAGLTLIGGVIGFAIHEFFPHGHTS